LNKKDKNDKDVAEVELQDTVATMGETTPVVASQAGGSSPWDPLFNPELFLERMVDMAGSSSRFNNTPNDELLRRRPKKIRPLR
jgi:hypothetical protein